MRSVRGRAGALVAGVLVLLAVAGPWVLPYDALKPDYANTYAPASAAHALGTDALGRDVLTRTLTGGRTSLVVGLLSAAWATALGSVLGVLSQVGPRWLDALLVRLFDALLAFPGFLLVLLVAVALGGGVLPLVGAMGLAGAPSMFRLSRGLARSVGHLAHVEAARALGASSWRVWVRHAVPGMVAPLAVQAASLFSTFLLVEATLSYLGLGIPLPQPSWGNVLQDARALLLRQPWAAIGPGMMLLAAAWSAQALADGWQERDDRPAYDRVGSAS